MSFNYWFGFPTGLGFACDAFAELDDETYETERHVLHLRVFFFGFNCNLKVPVSRWRPTPHHQRIKMTFTLHSRPSSQALYLQGRGKRRKRTTKRKKK